MTSVTTESLPKRILVSTDFSPASEAALYTGSTMAKHYGARLAVGHVAPLGGVLHPAFPKLERLELLEVSELERRATAAVLAYTHNLIGKGEGDLDVLVASTSSSATADTIAQQAVDYKADLVVVGSHGRTGLERAWIGSVAERVVRTSPCDVLVARAEKKNAKPGPVLAAIDLGETSTHVLRVAAREATARGSELVALYALDAPNDMLPYGMLGPFGIYVAPPDPKGQDELREAAEKTLRAALEAADVRAKVTILDGRAPHEILRLAESQEASLIVCGTHARKGLARVALGSVAESVVRHAGCSVMVVRM